VAITQFLGYNTQKLSQYTEIITQSRCCSEINSDYSYTFLRNVVPLSVCLSSVCYICAPCLHPLKRYLASMGSNDLLR